MGGVPPASLPRLYSSPGNSAGVDTLEMGKYLDMQINVLSNSLIIHKKVSQAMETLGLKPTHAWEDFPAAHRPES